MASLGSGRRGGGRGRADLPLNANINVTSLVDVAFTLLVIFIITAPILQGGVDTRFIQCRVAQKRMFRSATFQFCKGLPK